MYLSLLCLSLGEWTCRGLMSGNECSRGPQPSRTRVALNCLFLNYRLVDMNWSKLAEAYSKAFSEYY